MDTLYLTDDDTQAFEFTLNGVIPTAAYGDALLLQDDLSFPNHPVGEARVADIEVIQAGGWSRRDRSFEQHADL